MSFIKNAYLELGAVHPSISTDEPSTNWLTNAVLNIGNVKQVTGI